MAKKLSNYARAVARWKLAGSPVRDDAETERIYETLCKPCEHFNGRGCSVCGCRVGSGKNALANKIRMATESCPKGKW